MERRSYALRLAYDGGRFRGFQRQPGLPTVQQALEEALERLGVRAQLHVAARTDAGVHALAQVVSFSARAALDPAALRRGLNEGLPEGILVLDAARVGPSFHARGSAASRTYVYLVGAPPPEGLRPYAWTLPDARAFPELAEVPPLDAAAMREALGAAVGEHDFVGFARPGEQRGTVRTLLRAEVVEAGWAPLVAVVLEGKGFLRAMVRNLVGTAVAVGLGRAPPDVIRTLLATRGRYRGVRAPGWGLTLAAVRYPDGAWPSPAAPPDPAASR
ncbi:tRNA pseudouridine(38-40) synthase TruA [Anaeromyxobacter dehalogenans]|uniref:tRNA pseudouridine synthase A n=1 Tax=Anaeromyxobacter dehalogenans (strain 2CP-C) TaxID=290397 RepID=Q2II39_ANADE|nr:tRNA pseudouridine(38-40) synthase TruA [Anaeromyxobacter dehalogenans]ABC81317.1 tRNA pseudouridine synthase A [Anaeromyxobacter dehalogenans 2CP-C]